MDSENYSKTKLEEDKLIFSSPKVREGWAKSFQEMAANNDDELLINDTIFSEYDEEWEWQTPTSNQRFYQLVSRL